MNGRERHYREFFSGQGDFGSQGCRRDFEIAHDFLPVVSVMRSDRYSSSQALHLKFESAKYYVSTSTHFYYPVAPNPELPSR